MPGKLEDIAEKIHHSFEVCTSERDRALTQARTLTRHCANAIRAIHRDEHPLARQHLEEARQLVQSLRDNLKDLPDLFYAGYTQDALKEYAEAALVYALIDNSDFPSPDDLTFRTCHIPSRLGRGSWRASQAVPGYATQR